MPIDDDATKEQQARLETLIDEFKQAQRRRLVKRGLAPLERAAADTPVTNAESLARLN